MNPHPELPQDVYWTQAQVDKWKREAEAQQKRDKELYQDILAGMEFAKEHEHIWADNTARSSQEAADAARANYMAQHAVQELNTYLDGADFEVLQHIVQPGETLSEISYEHNTTVDIMQVLNGLMNPDHLDIGQQLAVIPDLTDLDLLMEALGYDEPEVSVPPVSVEPEPPTGVGAAKLVPYIVKGTETWAGLARSRNIDVTQLRDKINGGGTLVKGRTIYLPEVTSTQNDKPNKPDNSGFTTNIGSSVCESWHLGVCSNTNLYPSDAEIAAVVEQFLRQQQLEEKIDTEKEHGQGSYQIPFDTWKTEGGSNIDIPKLSERIAMLMLCCKEQGLDRSETAFVLATGFGENRMGAYKNDSQSRFNDSAMWEQKSPQDANHEYGGILGNATYSGDNPAVSDGFRYRGRGFVQITGRAKYRELQDAYVARHYPPEVNILQNPDLVAQDPKLAAELTVFGMLEGYYGAWAISKPVLDANGKPILDELGNEKREILHAERVGLRSRKVRRKDGRFEDLRRPDGSLDLYQARATVNGHDTGASYRLYGQRAAGFLDVLETLGYGHESRDLPNYPK